MNAYELADELLRDNTQLTVKAAYMLRQQANRIAELEKALEHEGISVGRDLLNGGVALSKKLPQTKPLTDEEILNEWLGNDRNFYYFARAIEERHGIK